jgi:hypothetical protein
VRTLAEIYADWQSPDDHGDKGTAHSYVELYEELLRPYRRGGLYIIEDIFDLDRTLPFFEALQPGLEVFDRRGVKNRFDDVLLVYRFPAP